MFVHEICCGETMLKAPVGVNFGACLNVASVLDACGHQVFELNLQQVVAFEKAPVAVAKAPCNFPSLEAEVTAAEVSTAEVTAKFDGYLNPGSVFEACGPQVFELISQQVVAIAKALVASSLNFPSLAVDVSAADQSLMLDCADWE